MSKMTIKGENILSPSAMNRAHPIPITLEVPENTELLTQTKEREKKEKLMENKPNIKDLIQAADRERNNPS